MELAGGVSQMTQQEFKTFFDICDDALTELVGYAAVPDEINPPPAYLARVAMAAASLKPAGFTQVELIALLAIAITRLVDHTALAAPSRRGDA